MSDDKPKTVVPPTRGRGGPHPAEVNEHLGLAYQLCDRLVEAAELRGDQVGADAWLAARNAIEAAEKAMQAARGKQTWRSTNTRSDYLALCRTIVSMSKHGPGATGAPGPCDAGCLKCIADTALAAWARDGSP